MTWTERRCVLLAGGMNATYNYPRYGHELMWWGERLASTGFACWAAIGDASVQSVPGVKVTDARRKNAERALKWLAKTPEGGLALLVASNHGSRDGLCLWGSGQLAPNDVDALLDPRRATFALIFGQCYAGVFGVLAGPALVVASACGPYEPSWACAEPPGLAYDEFLYQMGTALVGAPNDAPQPGPQRKPLSLLDAFHWARAQDRRPESPALFDPAGLASSIYL